VQKIRKIALLMERLVGFNHDVLQGVRDYAAPKKAWMCHFVDPKSEYMDVLQEWNPHGIIAFLFDERTLTNLQQLKCPFVDVATWQGSSKIPRISVDDVAVGRLAAEHLMDLGLERFAFVGRIHYTFSEMRQKGFQNVLHENGFDCTAYALNDEHVPVSQPWTMGGVNANLSDWVRSLPKPIGIFADNDERALMVSEACFAGEIDVPSQVAILGVDNDPYLGSLGYPPLSSIATPARRVGYEAALLLDRLMAGARAPDKAILLPPTTVVSRRSTDTLAINDPYVAAAVRLIRERACDGLTVPEVIKAAPVGRRTLEKLFKDHLGHSLLDEIRHVRLLRAQHLLATTDLPVDSVATRSGFGSATWLATTFSQELGVSPRAYRITIQGESS
jgi:LacI family transcriptional regulator